MPGPEAYTLLENFTLVHALYSSGTSDLPFFAELSKFMKSNTFITRDDSYDPLRLEPDSLKDLYLQLLREEAERKDHEAVKPGIDGSGQDNPRKRKLSSPAMLNLNEGPLRMDLLLPLIDRLYLAYRNHAVETIQDEERKYRLLHQEIQEINRGEWDTRLQNQENDTKKDSRGVSSIQTILRHDSDVEKTGRENTPQITKSPQMPETLSTNTVPGPTLTQDFHQNQSLDATEVRNKSDGDPKQTGSGTANQLPNAEPASLNPQAQEVVSKDSSGSLKTEPPQASGRQDFSARSQPIVPPDTSLSYLPPPQSSNPVYPPPLATLESNNRRLPYLPTQPQTMGAPLPSPRLNQTSMAPHDRSSQSPIILPPPPGMLRSSGSPPGPLDALADMAGQQFRSNPSLPSPRPVQHNTGQSHPIQLPQPRNFQQPVYSYYDNQQPYGPSYQPYGQTSMPNYHRPSNPSGSIYQAPQSHTGRGSYGNVPLYQSPAISYSQYPAYPHGSSYYQTPVQPPYNRAQASRFIEGRTPVSTSSKPRPRKPSPIITSALATKWKKLDLPGPVRTPGSPIRPRPEEISPISDRAPSPVLESPDHQDKPPKDSRSRNTRGSYTRGRRGRRLGTRAGSAASSNVTDAMQPRTRSHSVLSHADELSMDNNASSNARIKHEPPATPVIDEDTEITETTADEGSSKPTRRRRGTIRGLEMGPGVERAGMQNKRDSVQESYSLRSGLTGIAPHKHPNLILGSRNFPRTSATIMNDISAHKLASMFAKPLTEREAPGYKDLIYRPQDLKSIKSAILAGSKALVVAADTVGAGTTSSPAQTGSGTPNLKGASPIWVPATADVMPPKGIVNSAQLEKELMRMFANAVMFNRDPKRGVGPKFRDVQRSRRGGSKADGGGGRLASKQDEEMEDQDTNEDEEEEEDEGGVVRDTREMFEAVEKSVADWRAAERAVEDLVVGGRKAAEREDDGMADELAGDEERLEESTVGNKRKRR